MTTSATTEGLSRIREWMTLSPVTVTPETPVPRAHELMLSRRVRHLPVVEDDRVVGIITDRDLRTVQPSPATSFSVGEIRFLLEKLTVAEVMSKPAVTISPDAPLAEGVRVMLHRKFGALPVAEHERLVGIITETDLLRALGTTLVGPAPSVPARADADGTLRPLAAIRKILVPLDGSTGSESILPTIAELAEAEAAKIRLLHVSPHPKEIRSDGRVVAYADQETTRIEQEVLAYLRRVASGYDRVDVELAVRFGEPVKEIIAEAQAEGADVIAMATHRRTGMQRIVKGSVAEQVERGTAIPVILVQHGN